MLQTSRWWWGYRLVSCWWRAYSAGCCTASCRDATDRIGALEQGARHGCRLENMRARLIAAAIEEIINEFATTDLRVSWVSLAAAVTGEDIPPARGGAIGPMRQDTAA